MLTIEQITKAEQAAEEYPIKSIVPFGSYAGDKYRLIGNPLNSGHL